MSITELDLYCKEIAWTYDVRNLHALRAKFMGLLKEHKISRGLYDGLNREIRDRADWLKSRGK